MTVVETYPTLDQAARAMGGDAAFLGGGTLVMRAVNEGVAPARLIRVTGPGLSELRVSGDSVRIGAGVTMADVLASRDLEFLHPVARVIGGPQVRNMATVAGNLFAAHPFGDFAAALLALDARVIGAGQGGARPVADVLRDRARAGLVAAIEVPRPRDPKAFGFLKVSRVKPRGVSILSIAAYLPREGGRIRGARVAFGAMGPVPLRSSGAERALEGQSLGAAAIDSAASAATEGLDPPTDEIASAWYRKEVAGVHLKRLLTDMERR
ncbi:FAD binding domain-containing protein [Sedimentitalea sp. JM2-8]|uniref:FAD binding domain-containing protein n=1 Tax=Sedimentitalea xiamensis TaxID=3050037 RepID=A0ABT7FHT0_9RHOB|nr:FAD binding domain-containing protein [Sedimentitalea xiamensis]MDK3074638.1 FAD binding domain-containing protein [Sedimentitalea xiamensis]